MSTPLSQVELDELMHDAAQDACAIAKDEFGISLDFSIASVALVDDLLLSFVERYPDDSQVDKIVFTLSNVFGAYLGEVFKTETQAQWHMSCEESSTIVLQAKANEYAFAGICYERLAKKSQVNVMSYFAIAMEQAKS